MWIKTTSGELVNLSRASRIITCPYSYSDGPGGSYWAAIAIFESDRNTYEIARVDTEEQAKRFLDSLFAALHPDVLEVIKT